MSNAATSTTNRQFDWDDVDPNAQEATKDSYPYFQWHHGNSELDALGSEDVRYSGGLLFPLGQKANRFGEGFALPDFKPVTVKLGRDKQQCLGATSAQFAILRRRFCWLTKDDRGREQYFSAKTTPYVKGMKGKMQLLAIPKGIEPEKSHEHLFVITSKASAQVNMNKALNDHAELIVAAANRTAPAGKKLPPYALYTHIGAAKHVVVGEGQDSSEVTQPMLYRPDTITRDYLIDVLYIGKERLRIFQEIWHSLDEWAHAWDTDAGVKGEFSTENANDIWACDDAQVDEFIKLCAALKARGETMERLNAIAQSVAGVTNIKLAKPLAMASVIEQFDKQLKYIDHQARMALQAPTGYNQPGADDAADYGVEPTADDIPFDR